MGDATADGAVNGADFLIWQTWFPYHTADFDGSGAADANDYFIWRLHYATQTGTGLADGDADHSGIIDYADFLLWLGQMGPNYSPPADFNGDGKVDGADWLIWQNNLGKWPNGGATKADGDANGDGKVDGLDLLEWQRWYPYPPIPHPESNGPVTPPPHP
jgi:hypothetical protein